MKKTSNAFGVSIIFFSLLYSNYCKYYATKINTLGKSYKNYQVILTNFNTFLNELKEQKIILSLQKQSEWKDFFEKYKTEITQVQTEISKTNRVVDQMVYDLYGLTEEEIKIVEDSV